LHSQSEDHWRGETDLVIAPDVQAMDWNAFEQGPWLIRAGEAAAQAALPRIQEWFVQPHTRAA